MRRSLTVICPPGPRSSCSTIDLCDGLWATKPPRANPPSQRTKRLAWPVAKGLGPSAPASNCSWSGSVRPTERPTALPRNETRRSPSRLASRKRQPRPHGRLSTCAVRSSLSRTLQDSDTPNPCETSLRGRKECRSSSGEASPRTRPTDSGRVRLMLQGACEATRNQQTSRDHKQDHAIGEAHRYSFLPRRVQSIHPAKLFSEARATSVRLSDGGWRGCLHPDSRV
jgi:hypothetical protein